MRKDYYTEISKAIERYERGVYAPVKVDWITDRIAWAWKFRKINRAQMIELCDRITEVLEYATAF